MFSGENAGEGCAKKCCCIMTTRTLHPLSPVSSVFNDCNTELLSHQSCYLHQFCLVSACLNLHRIHSVDRLKSGENVTQSDMLQEYFS